MSPGQGRVPSTAPVPPAWTSLRLSSGLSSSKGCRSRGRQARSLQPFTAPPAVRPRAQLAHPDCPSGCHPCRSRSSTGRSPGGSDPAGFPGRHSWKERTGQSREGIWGRCRARGARVSPRQPLPPRRNPSCAAEAASPLHSPSTALGCLSHRSSRSPSHTSPQQERRGRQPPARGRRHWQPGGTRGAALPGYLPISLGCRAPLRPLP